MQSSFTQFCKVWIIKCSCCKVCPNQHQSFHYFCKVCEREKSRKMCLPNIHTHTHADTHHQTQLRQCSQMQVCVNDHERWEDQECLLWVCVCVCVCEGERKRKGWDGDYLCSPYNRGLKHVARGTHVAHPNDVSLFLTLKIASFCSNNSSLITKSVRVCPKSV